MMLQALLNAFSMNSACLHRVGLAVTLFAIFTGSAPARAAEPATQEMVINAISSGRDASSLLQSMDRPAGGGIAARHTMGKQLALALTSMANAVNAGDIARIQQAYENVRGSAMLAREDSAELKTKLADPLLPGSFEARRSEVQLQMDRLMKQLATAMNALNGTSKQQAEAIDALRSALLATGQGETNAPVLRAALLPVRALSLAARVPALSPSIRPSYMAEEDRAATPEDIGDSPEAPLSEEILAKTKELNYDYVRIYEYVRNNLRTEWYTGSIKGAVGALRTGSGNAVDQASLLIAMMRAAGAPARYVQGVVEVSVESIALAAGMEDASLIPDMLAKAGIAYVPVIQGGRVALVRIEHTWVTVQVPYTNYRGIVLDATGKTWLPLDVFYKSLQPRSSNVSIHSLGLDLQILATQYRSSVQAQDFGSYVRARINEALRAQSSETTYENAVAPAAIKAQTLGLLPNTMAITVMAATAESTALPDVLRSTARIRLFNDASGTGNAGLDVTLPVHEPSTISPQRWQTTARSCLQVGWISLRSIYFNCARNCAWTAFSAVWGWHRSTVGVLSNSVLTFNPLLPRKALSSAFLSVHTTPSAWVSLVLHATPSSRVEMVNTTLLACSTASFSATRRNGLPLNPMPRD